jgi:four helix bundle protein
VILQVWQKAHQLVLLIYKITAHYPKFEIYGLISQMRRASISIVPNIIEGFKRKSIKDSLNFYNIADASLEELKYQLLLSYELKYITEKEYKDSFILAEEVSKCCTLGLKVNKSIQK